MQVLNRTPLQFGSLAGRIPFPGHSLTVLVKGTYDLKAGVPAALAEEQLHPTGDGCEPEDEEREGSILYSSDFVFYKERADLLLSGRCHAPGGRPTARCNATFQVGNLGHTLQVTGNRYWTVRDNRWVTTEPEPFTEMPLCYERAFGGEGFGPNPIGKGAIDVAIPDGRTVRPLPNIEAPGALVAFPKDRPLPAGFGPLDPKWESRQTKLGTYGGDYLKKGWPWFAEDFDRGHFNAAPPALQLQGYLRGDERLVFENLHPEHPVYESALPGLRIRCFVNRKEADGGWDFAEVELDLDTLWVEMEAERLVLVWRGWTQAASPEHEDIGHVYIVSESMTEAPGSMEHHREGFSGMLAIRAARGGDEPSNEEEAAPAPGVGEVDEEPEAGPASTGDAGPGTAGDGDWDGPATEAEVLDPNLQRAIDEARPHLERLGIDPGELEGGDPEVVVPKLLEKLKTELRAHGVDPDNPPELTPEQKQYQAKFMADLGIPWNASTGLPDLEGFAPEDPESMIDQQMAKLKSELRAHGIDPDNPPEPTPEQKAHLAGMGIDFDALKEALEASAAEDGEVAEEEPSPEWVRERVEQGESLAGANLSGLELAGFILPGADLSGGLLAGAALAAADLEGADLRGANLAGADLRGAKLVGARLDEADLTEADLTGADLTGATLDDAVCERAVFQGARMEQCSAVRARFREADLKNVRAPEARLDRADLTDADLEGANLAKASLRDTRLNGANAPGVNLAQADLSGLRASQGANLRGSTFFRTEGSRTMWMESDLAGSDFSYARLEDPDFTGADLTGARMSAADLPRARFRKAILSGATLIQANLFEGSFERADLTGTDLRGSNLFAVEFLDATLDDARLEGANLKRTKLALEDQEA